MARAGNDELEDAAVREETDVLDLGSSSSSHAVGPTLNAAPSEAFRAGSLAVHPGKAAEAEKEKIAAQQAERLKEANALNSEPHGHMVNRMDNYFAEHGKRSVTDAWPTTWIPVFSRPPLGGDNRTNLHSGRVKSNAFQKQLWMKPQVNASATAFESDRRTWGKFCRAIVWL